MFAGGIYSCTTCHLLHNKVLVSPTTITYPTTALNKPTYHMTIFKRDGALRVVQ